MLPKAPRKDQQYNEDITDSPGNSNLIKKNRFKPAAVPGGLPKRRDSVNVTVECLDNTVTSADEIEFQVEATTP